jgi:hypothetical protein
VLICVCGPDVVGDFRRNKPEIEAAAKVRESKLRTERVMARALKMTMMMMMMTMMIQDIAARNSQKRQSKNCETSC